MTYDMIHGAEYQKIPAFNTSKWVLNTFQFLPVIDFSPKSDYLRLHTVQSTVIVNKFVSLCPDVKKFL